MQCLSRLSSILLVGALATGCSHVQHAAHDTGPTVSKAIAVMHPTDGNDVRGTVTFTSVAGGVRVEADIDGLTPGKHGFHVHQWGNATAKDGKSAGGHFNPHGKEHSMPTAEMRHVGDLGNLEADASGNAHYERVDSELAFSGMNSVVGRGLIIHAKEDDGGQPTGNAGARVAIGVIGIAEDSTAK